MASNRVYLGSCASYDREKIFPILEAAYHRLSPEKIPGGNVVIKPNLCMTHPRITSLSYTHREVTAAIIRLVRAKGRNLKKVDIVEKSGLGVTTASMFRWAGYRSLRREFGVNLCAMEERPRTRVVLDRGRVHRHITIAEEMARRDFLIFAPKMKTNVLSHAYTGALKLNIGTVDSRERIYHHDKDLHVKIVDILEAANPDLIVTDGIRLSFGGNQMTQHDGPLGVIAVSSNVVAHDMVCAHLLGLEPLSIEHIREAADRGYGPASLEEIEILGDYPPERGRSAVRGLDFGFMPVQDFPCNFTMHSGVPYCVGGCQGIFLDWLHMIRDRKPRLLKRFPGITVLLGRVEKPIRDGTVLLLGECAQASKHYEARRVVRIRGCPPTHKRIVWDMMIRFFLLAPLVRPSLIIDGFVLYPLKRLKGWLMNLRFRPPES